jgi:exosortase/archaeosortase family protein
MEKMLHPYRLFLEFLTKLLGIYLLWRIIQFFAGEESMPIELRYWPAFSIAWENLHQFIRDVLIILSVPLIELFGTLVVENGYSIVSVDKQVHVALGNYCLGLEMMVLYATLLLTFPGILKGKMIFLPIGLIIIQLVNAFRIAALFYTYQLYPQYMDVNHHFIFRIVVFGVILGLFYFWLQWEAKHEVKKAT